MAVWGLDVEQVQSLGKQLNQQSQQVQTILTTLTSALQSTAALKQVIAALEDASQKAAKNAADQESTSNA
jgi:hypothetical protein